MTHRSGDSRADRWFRRVFVADVQPGRAITAGSPIVLLRMVVMGLICVAAQFEEVEHPGTVTGLLLAAILAQPLIAAVPGGVEQSWRRFFVVDLCFSTAIAMAAPSIAMNHLLVAVGLIGAAATCFRVRGFLLFAAAASVSIAAVMVAADEPQPAQFVIAGAIVGLGFGGWMLRARLVADAARRDREQAVDAAGGIFFTGRVGDTVLTCLGDIESLLGWTDRDDGRLDLKVTVHPDDFDDYWVADEELHEGTEFVRTARFRTDGNGWKWIRAVTRVVERNGALELRGLMLDHTDHLDGLLKAKSEASTDALTGLANRRVLATVLDREDRPGRHLVLFDLDSFKKVNDTLGHDAGDQLLRIVAQRIGARIRSSDLLVRLGGDEFALVLDGDLPSDEVRQLVGRILDSVSEPMNVNGVVLDTAASAGIVCDDDPERRGVTAMLRRADLAMYEAKRNATGSELFSISMDERHGRKAALVRDLPDALANGDLRLFFQPILDIDGRTVRGAEGLARWVHPTHGLLMPADFLDVILVSSQAAAFTRAMVLDAMEMASEFALLGDPVAIAANLPTSTLEDPAFSRWFFDEAAELGVDPSHLVFETSERELHSDARTAGAIGEFTDRGVTISIDDFGTGHATFERLRWTGVAQLKLDQRMVQGAAADPRDAIILRNVVTMAKELGYSIVGEGVETEAQRSMLDDIGVDLVQGHLFSMALDREDFIDFVSRAHVMMNVVERELHPSAS